MNLNALRRTLARHAPEPAAPVPSVEDVLEEAVAHVLGAWNDKRALRPHRTGYGAALANVPRPALPSRADVCAYSPRQWEPHALPDPLEAGARVLDARTLAGLCAGWEWTLYEAVREDAPELLRQVRPAMRPADPTAWALTRWNEAGRPGLDTLTAE